jgi:trimeric autotransporter adhesin
MKTVLLIFLLIPEFLNAQIITTIAGTGTTGYSGDGGSAATEFNLPGSVRFDHTGNMYIADWVNNVIRKINTSGIITTVAGNGYGAGMPGVGGYTGDGGQATAAEFDGPSDVAFDMAGNMYIADQSNSAIRKVNTSGIITTIARTGSSGYNGDGIAATSAELNQPIGIAFDNAGNLYIGDESNNRVCKINTTGIITTVAGTGTAGYNADGIPATAAELNAPCWVAISSTGDLYIPELQNHRVRKVDSSGIITTVAGNGMPGVSGDGLPATSANIGGSVVVEFDALGNFYISNAAAASCSIRKVNTTGIISTVAGNDTCGYGGWRPCYQCRN